jgi:predicted membrane protein
MGRLRVICPETLGHTEIELKTTLGTIEVIIPEGVGAQVTVSHGSLGTVRQKNERLLAPGQRRYVTADFESAAAQVDIRIEAASGDVVLA